MTSIALIRHGPTLWNEQRRLQGQADIPLSADGIKRVKTWRVPNRFIEYRWFVSPLMRARQTAAILGLTTKTEPAIIEMDWGEWDGRTGQELQDKYGEGFSERKKQGIDLRPDEGESPREVRQRVREWIGRVSQNGLPTGAVSHQGIIRATMSLATGWNMINPPPEEIKWDAIHLFEINSKGDVKIMELNISLIPETLNETIKGS